MPIQTDSLNRKLYELLNSRGYDPVPRDSDVANAGKTVPPEEADVFKFTFKQGDEAIDDAWVSVDGAENLTMYYDKNLANKAGERSPGTQFDDSWYGLLRHLKKWAHARQLSFKLEPKEKIDSDMSQRTYMKKKEQIAEGYHPMGKTASYNDAVPTVKIILQHTRQVQEGEQRYRNVAKIFLENAQGERFLSPTSKPGLAQVYARHIAEGGVPNDDRWNHLKSLCEEYSKMAGFVRAVRSNQFNESAQRVVEAGLNHYQSLRESLGKLRGHRGYTSYFESYTPPLMEDDTDSNALNELFVQETLDPRIESVMPILNKLSKNLGEMKEVSELAEWADSLIEGGDGGEASEEPVQQIEEAPGAETLAHNQSTEKSRLDAFDLDETDGGQEALNPGGIPEEDELVQEGKPSKTDLAMAYLKAVVMAPTGTPENERIRNWQEKLEDEFDIEMDTATLAQMLPQFDSMLQAGKLDKLQNRMASRGELEIGESQHGVEEGMLDGGDDIDSPVASAILRRILMQRLDLLSKYGPEKVSNAIGDVADFVGDVDEIGSSDVSGWIKQVEMGLGGIDEGIIDKIKDVGQKALDTLGHGSDEDLLRDLKKRAGVRNPENGKPSMAHSDVEKVDEELDADQKRAGQWGPTGGPAKIGNLVGENFINTDDQAVVTEVDTGEYDARKSSSKGETTPEQEKDFRKKVQAYGKELDQRQKEKEKVKEGHDDLAAMLRIINR